MNSDLKHEIDKTMSDFKELTAGFSEKEFNQVPFEGSWSAGQVGQHMIMSNSGFVDIIQGPAKETTRKPDDLVTRIKSDFLNFDIKMESPESVRPQLKSYEKKQILDSLDKVRASLNETISTHDLTKTCTAFELPGYGYLTRLEAANFVLYHTMRHIHQLKKIRERVTA